MAGLLQLGNLLLRSLCLSSVHRHYRWATISFWHVHEHWDPNSGLHVCTASALPIEPQYSLVVKCAFRDNKQVDPALLFNLLVCVFWLRHWNHYYSKLILKGISDEPPYALGICMSTRDLNYYIAAILLIFFCFCFIFVVSEVFIVFTC